MHRLTSSSAPFANRGQQARLHAEIYVIFLTDNLCQALTCEVRGQAEIPKLLSV